jgi:Aspartyl protease
MFRKFFDARRIACALARTGIVLHLLLAATHLTIAQNCKVVHHAPPSDADTAFLAGDFPLSVGLYRTALARSPGDADLMIGLIHALLRQHKVQEAADALQEFSKPAPDSPTFMTLRGELELRQGGPWKAAKTALASYTLDPCNPRTMLLLSRLEALNSQFATARKVITKAHQIDSEDAEIRAAWIRTLPVGKRIPEMEAYLATPRGDSAADRQGLQTDLYHLKAWATEPRKPCTMASTAATAEIPFVPILSNSSDRTIAFGLSVKVNNHAARLAIDTSYNARLPIEGVSGLLISRAAAQHSGLKPIYQNDVPGTGPQGPRSGFVAIADSIAIGDVEFHDCAVQVMDVNFPNGAEGVVGLEILSSYLITLDYPAKKLLLEALPPRPQEMVATDGLYNRYTAPAMKDYASALVSGSDLIVPLSLNGSPPMLFVLDTAIDVSAVSPGAAYELTTGHKDIKFEDRDAKAKWNVISLTGDNQLSFAGVTLKESPIMPFDTSRFTDDTGMEVSGMLGLKTLSRMTIHIDYRDGLLKLDYDPARKGPLIF